ncbi:MAG TPA: hypothetical protein VM010_01430 [Chitinophagaceae bacterium]|nr:hypothetical protein [Chitinophagaceae bacterium]
MNKGFLLPVLLLFFGAACKNKVKEGGDASGYFPVLSYLQSQVRQVDTSVYSITKITKQDGFKDTAYIRREDFRKEAADFLSVPDLASAKWRDNYSETKLYDEDLKKVIITYEPKDRAALPEITRQDVLIEPDAGSGDQVQTIYIETTLSNDDSTIQKKMTWNVATNFQVIKIISKKNRPEVVQTTDVSWTNGH